MVILSKHLQKNLKEKVNEAYFLTRYIFSNIDDDLYR